MLGDAWTNLGTPNAAARSMRTFSVLGLHLDAEAIGHFV